MLLLASLITLGYGQITVLGGKCATVPLIADFDIVQYGGVWYDILSYPMSQADPDNKCVTAYYGLIDETTVSVNNTNVIPLNGGRQKLEYLVGQGKQTEPETFPNKFYVSFNFGGQPDTNVGEANYNVMDTDYENYSIVTNCEDNGVSTVEYTSILSKNQSFLKTEMFKDVLAKAESEFGFKTNLAREVPQEPEDCQFDFVGPNSGSSVNRDIYKSISKIFSSVGQILFITYKLTNIVV